MLIPYGANVVGWEMASDIAYFQYSHPMHKLNDLPSNFIVFSLPCFYIDGTGDFFFKM